MQIVNANGTVLGSVRLTGEDIAGLSRGMADELRIAARVDALRAQARANMSGLNGGAPSGPVGPSGPAGGNGAPTGPTGPAPAAPRPDGPAPRGGRFKRWHWLLIGFMVLGTIGAIADDSDKGSTSAPTVAETRVPLANVGSPRAQPLDNGDIIIGSTAVDNVLRSGSPLRNRFTAILAEQGASGLTGKSLDSNVNQAISFCQRYADGDPAAARQAQVATRTIPGAAHEMGAQQRAVILGALSAVCPAL